MPGRFVRRANFWINYRRWSGATAGIWCMVRETISETRKLLHGDEFSRIRTTDRRAGGEDRGIEILEFGCQRQHRRGGQTVAAKEPGFDHQYFCEPVALADHAAGASSAAALYARLLVDDLYGLAGTAWRSHVQRRFGHRGRFGASRGHAGDGDRPPKRP